MDCEELVQFHTLWDPFSDKHFRGRILFPREISRPALLAREITPTEELLIGRAEGRMFSDILWTDNVSVVLLSEAIVREFRQQSFSGWSTYPVRIDSPLANQRYYGLAVTGRCGPLDWTRGEWVHRDDRPGRFLRGMFFDQMSWDGSDIFLPHDSSHIFLTERVRNVVEALPNVRCERLCDVLTSETVIDSTLARLRREVQ